MISLPKIPRVIERDGNRAIIEISELYPGYGFTLGNVLRRVLYSSLPGTAITSVKIDGISHEFSTIKGVLEDVLEITLSLKGVRLILHGEEAQTITLKAKGKGEVKAGDIDTPSQVEIVNKDAHIATLTSSSASLRAEMRVEAGLGYVQANSEQKEKKEIGVIKLDAIFTPVLKVNFEVENMRVGDKTDYNRLLLDLTTDGTITPEEAFSQAVGVLVEHFDLLGQLEIKSTSKKKKVTAKKKASKKKTTAKKTPKKATASSGAPPKAVVTKKTTKKVKK